MQLPNCADCDVYVCRLGHPEHARDDCPMCLGNTPFNAADYADPRINALSTTSARVESAGYMRWTRVEETMEFARRLGVQRLGLAFCAGLRQEAKVLSRILKANGFEVASACCKTGAMPKETLGLRDEDKVRPGQFEAMCNPIAQARLLAEAETGLNVLMGLCVGHDSLFIAHSKALVTCLVAKDRVLAHNPIGALNCSYGYWHDALYTRHTVPQQAG